METNTSKKASNTTNRSSDSSALSGSKKKPTPSISNSLPFRSFHRQFLESQFFLRVVATSKIAHRPTCLLGSLMSARFNSSGYPLSKRPELFEQHATATQIKIHLSRIKQHPQTSAETNPIKAAQNMRDLLAKFVIKTFRNAVWCWCGLVFHPPLLPTPTALQHPRSLVAATPR